MSEFEGRLAIVSGASSGIGEVEIEGVGTIQNPVVSET